MMILNFLKYITPFQLCSHSFLIVWIGWHHQAGHKHTGSCPFFLIVRGSNSLILLISPVCCPSSTYALLASDAAVQMQDPPYFTCWPYLSSRLLFSNQILLHTDFTKRYAIQDSIQFAYYLKIRSVAKL